MFQPTTTDEFKAIWPFLSHEEKEAYVAAGTLRTIVHATNNQSILGSNYSGKAAVRRVYIFGPDDIESGIIGEVYDWERVDEIDPMHVYQTIGLGVKIEPRIQYALAVTNGGVFPVILPPVIPPVVVIEEPVQTQPDDETPA